MPRAGDWHWHMCTSYVPVIARKLFELNVGLRCVERKRRRDLTAQLPFQDIIACFQATVKFVEHGTFLTLCLEVNFQTD